VVHAGPVRVEPRVVGLLLLLAAPAAGRFDADDTDAPGHDDEHRDDRGASAPAAAGRAAASAGRAAASTSSSTAGSVGVKRLGPAGVRDALLAWLVSVPVFVAACAVPDGGLLRAARFR